MLTIPIATLAYIVTKAREFDAEVPPVNEDSGSNPSDDADRDVFEASADNPTRQELADAIDGLGDPERIELLALTWLGRGDYSKEEWGEALEEARRIHDEKDDRHAVACRLSRRGDVAAGLFARRIRDRPNVARSSGVHSLHDLSNLRDTAISRIRNR